MRVCTDFNPLESNALDHLARKQGKTYEETIKALILEKNEQLTAEEYK